MTATDLDARRANAPSNGGARAIALRHERGLLSAHERIEVLFDDRSFEETALFAGAGVVTGNGTIGGRRVFVYAQDATVAGGSLSPVDAAKICSVLDQAMRLGAPVVGLLDTEGTRLEDGLAGIASLGDVQRRQVRASANIPQISLVMGPCVGAASALAALGDLLFMVDGSSSLFLTGPDVAEAVTGETVTGQELGGAGVHGARSGLADLVFDDEVEALLQVRHCLGFLPASRGALPAVLPTPDPATRDDPSLDTLVSRDSSRPHDIRELVGKVADEGDVFELQAGYAGNIVTAFARLNGSAVGVVANQNSVLAGCLDGAALGKAARFVRLCGTFGVPLVTFVDTPGFVPGTAQEHTGIVRHAAQLLAAYAACSVPRITVIVGRAHGGAYGVMAPKALGSDVVLAWTCADIALLGGGPPAGPSAAAAIGQVDDVIAPAQTRPCLCRALATLRFA